MSKSLGIVLLDDLETEVIEGVVALVSERLGVGVSLLGRAEHHVGFDPERRQWRADRMAETSIEKFSSSDRFCVGLTAVDLYVPPLNFVFGLALREEGLAVISWHRLRTEGGAFTVRLAKEIIHEVGHLEGLDHCARDACVMQFSNTLSETDRKGLDFCPACSRRRR